MAFRPSRAQGDAEGKAGRRSHAVLKLATRSDRARQSVAFARNEVEPCQLGRTPTMMTGGSIDRSLRSKTE